MTKGKLAQRILSFHFGLKPTEKLPGGVEWLYPYDSEETQEAMRSFFSKYFDDNNERILLLGINPGRFGAGITGLPFTDPIRMLEVCGLENDFDKRQELSSVFVYEVIDQMGGAERFYQQFYISSICPLGFVLNGKNYNYYDSKELMEAVMPMIIDNIDSQIDLGMRTEVAFSMGQGKNFKILKALNQEHKFFEKVLPLPHPRWVMQYRLKRKQEFIDEYVQKLSPYVTLSQK